MDIALLDVTFYSPNELPDRDVTKIKHLLMTDTMDLLGPLVKVLHALNHSNPALDAGGAAREAIEERGFLSEGRTQTVGA